MTSMEILGGRRDVSGGYKVDVSRGERISRVSSEWFSRPTDERFLSLSELFVDATIIRAGDRAKLHPAVIDFERLDLLSPMRASVRSRAERSNTRTVESAAIKVDASRNNPDRLALMLPGSEAPVAPTHWSFGQLAALVGAPGAYLRQLPAPLAGINLQYGLTGEPSPAHRSDPSWRVCTAIDQQARRINHHDTDSDGGEATVEPETLISRLVADHGGWGIGPAGDQLHPHRSITASKASTSPHAIVYSAILSASRVWTPTTHFDGLISTETKMSLPVG